MCVVKWIGLLALGVAGWVSVTAVHASGISCQMTFQLSGW